jgi:7-cyano-7-deazaguanine synthase
MPSGVLLSGGLDSAVLLADEAAQGVVWPIYVQVGLAWEAAEQQTITALLDSAPYRSLQALTSLEIDMSDVYPAHHWAMRGAPPAYDTPDEDVYLPGRNVVLFGKAAVFCALKGLDRLVLGTLAHNPFPDASPKFRESFAAALSTGLDHRLHLDAPLAAMSKADVIRRGTELRVPFELTLSCMSPVTGNGLPRHCGTCSKCRERHDAFIEAAVEDPTDYANRTRTGTSRRAPPR